MDRIPPWIIKKGVKIIGKKGGGQIQGGSDPYDVDSSLPGLGTANGTGGSEVVTDRYARWFHGLGWDKFDYQKFDGAIQKGVDSGMSPEKAAEAAFGDLVRNNPDLADKVEASAGRSEPSEQSRDAAQPLATDVIKSTGAKADGPIARQVENDISRYLEAGFPPEVATAKARQNAQQELEKERQENREIPQSPQEPPKEGPTKGPYFPPQEGKLEGSPQEQQQAQAELEKHDTKPDPDAAPSAPEPTASTPPADPKVAALVEMAGTPVANPGQAALLKPVEALTEPEMKDMLASAQTDYRGWRSGDPLKAHTYERVQDWHVAVYGDGEQTYDGGKPVEARPIRPIPEQPRPHATPQGEDLWQATARIGRRVADAAAGDGADVAVKSLQRGLNILGEANPLPKRSPAYGPYTRLAPLAEDGQYGPRTDFALKHATARLGPAKVDEALALGRFNTFARDAQRNGTPEGLEDRTHAIFGPLLRKPGDTKAPKVEAGVLQQTLNGFGHDLKLDDWIGPKTTEAFRSVLEEEDADEVTRRFGKGLGLL